MAEGFARALKSDRLEAFSAGTQPHGLNPLAVRAMREAGVDISSHASKRPEEIVDPTGAVVGFDLVVTVCGNADESCPSFPGARIVHAGFDDPPRLAAHARSEGLTLVTNNLSEFERVPGLLAENWVSTVA